MERPNLLSAKETTRDTPRPAVVWAIAGAVVLGWGLNFVFAKEALTQVDVGPFNFVRFGAMLLLGWLVLLTTGGPEPVRPQDRWCLSRRGHRYRSAGVT